jgi:pantoate--beta-alanine ligase
MVPVVETIEKIRGAVGVARATGQRIGFVPTMGALHDGHVRLIERCRAESGFVVVSIFVNPTQFGPSEDFSRYPRTLVADCARCHEGHADIVFAPSVEEMYPSGKIATYVDVAGLTDRLEGATRPGHFRGVATVVLKLFAIVRPDLAFFGEKDYQQQLVIRRMVDDLNLAVAVYTVPTVREADGLALSSRNRYLGLEERRAATVLAKALERARHAFAAGERNAERVRQILRDTVKSEALARLDYAEVADADTLQPLDTLTSGRRAIVLLAAWVGTTRLIDNALLAG